MQKVGRRRWKQETGYHQQARVENTFFQYKAIIGGSLRARSPGGHVAEVVLACNILNLLIERGRPESYSVGLVNDPLIVISARQFRFMHQRHKEMGRRRWKKTASYHRAGPGGEHVLPVQVDHRRGPASAQSSRAGD